MASADKQSLEELETKLENEQTLDRDLQGKLRADVDRLEKALQKAEFAAQRQQQMREDKALEAKRERAVLQKQIDGHDDAVAKLNTNVQQQKRLFNAMRDERDLQTLSDCDLVQRFPVLRHDVQRMAYGSAACELVERLTIDNEPNQRLFRCLVGVLQALEEVTLDRIEKPVGFGA